MSYIKGVPREQLTLFPEKIDDYIDQNNAVRFIDTFVNMLDLKSLKFKYAERKEGCGRYSYDPADMLKLYIYSYINKIRSSRKIEEETHKNIELMWLIGKLKPDHKTISNFRNDNKACFKLLFREFTIFCLEIGLYEDKLIAIDGSKFKANNANNKCYNKKRINIKIKDINETIEKYLKTLEANDEIETTSAVIDENLQEKINVLIERKKNSKNFPIS